MLRGGIALPEPPGAVRPIRAPSRGMRGPWLGARNDIGAPWATEYRSLRDADKDLREPRPTRASVRYEQGDGKTAGKGQTVPSGTGLFLIHLPGNKLPGYDQMSLRDQFSAYPSFGLPVR